MTTEDLKARFTDLEARFTDLEARFTDLERRVLDYDEALHSSLTTSRKKKRELSVNEFLKEKGVTNSTSAVNVVLAIAAFNENSRGADFFRANDLRDLIVEARHTPPTNINDCINRNISKGYIAAHTRGEDGKKRWYLTNSGTDFVDNKFNENEQNT